MRKSWLRCPRRYETTVFKVLFMFNPAINNENLISNAKINFVYVCSLPFFDQALLLSLFDYMELLKLFLALRSD